MEGELQHCPHCSFYSNVTCSYKHRANVLLPTKWCLVWWKEEKVDVSSILKQYQGHKILVLPRLRPQCSSWAGQVSAFGEVEWQGVRQKKKWNVVWAENWKSGPLWGKLLSSDFFHGRTEIIVADHFTLSRENVIRLESLLQIKSIMTGKYHFPFFHSNWKLTYEITCLFSYVSELSFPLHVGFYYLTIICYL